MRNVYCISAHSEKKDVCAHKEIVLRISNEIQVAGSERGGLAIYYKLKSHICVHFLEVQKPSYPHIMLSKAYWGVLFKLKLHRERETLYAIQIQQKLL